MGFTREHEIMLARLSQTTQSPAAYQKMLESLPDNVKRTFIELDSGSIREYSVRSVKKRLMDNPDMAKLLDSVAVRQIVEQVYNNILEDQRKVRSMMGLDVQEGRRSGGRAGSGQRWRTIRR